MGSDDSWDLADRGFAAAMGRWFLVVGGGGCAATLGRGDDGCARGGAHAALQH